MGRLLLATSLVLLAFYTLSLVSVAVSLLTAPMQVWPNPTSWNTLVAGVATLVFLLALPVLLPVGLAVSLRVGRRPSNPVHTTMYDPIFEPKMCVVLTAYDDEESIYDAVRDFRGQDNVAEVIVVDNNSRDNTTLRAREAGATVVHEEKQGYGYSCIRGLSEAVKLEDVNIVVLAEGDGTFMGRDVKKMVPYLDNVDMVLGTRTTYELTEPDSQMDWFLSWGNMFLANLVRLRYWDTTYWGKLRLTDVGCTFRVMRRDSLERIVDQFYVGGNFFSPHMILVALRNNLRMIEIPVGFRKRVGASKGAGKGRQRATHIGLQMLWHILVS